MILRRSTTGETKEKWKKFGSRRKEGTNSGCSVCCFLADEVPKSLKARTSATTCIFDSKPKASTNSPECWSVVERKFRSFAVADIIFLFFLFFSTSLNDIRNRESSFRKERQSRIAFRNRAKPSRNISPLRSLNYFSLFHRHLPLFAVNSKWTCRRRWFFRILQFRVLTITINSSLSCLWPTASKRSRIAWLAAVAGGRRKRADDERGERGTHRAAERFALTRVTQSPVGLAPISRVSLEFVPRKKKRGEEQPDRVGETERERERERERWVRESRVESRRATRERVSACGCQRVTKRATCSHALRMSYRPSPIVSSVSWIFARRHPLFFFFLFNLHLYVLFNI